VAAAGHHTVIHLATHGEARLDNPMFAHLKLADGQLSMVDIFNLPLQGTLVTLSACETGRSVVAGGDELIGLSRGFLYAGAKTLVQSLWRVEDGSTAGLMTEFYRGIRAGCWMGDALRDAQRAMLATHGTHPFFWAPFQLIGDDGPLERV
jgi:CHAT domain-containing protein